MAEPVSNRSTSVRDARIAIWATVLFGPIGRHLVMITLMTWRGWSEKPAWIWKPFTIASLLVAAIEGTCWPMLGGDGLYKSVFGESFFRPTPETREIGFAFPLTYAAISYTIWSLAILPHTLVRIGWLLVHRIRSRRSGRPM
jgi:hypothetical protein